MSSVSRLGMDKLPGPRIIVTGLRTVGTGHCHARAGRGARAAGRQSASGPDVRIRYAAARAVAGSTAGRACWSGRLVAERYRATHLQIPQSARNRRCPRVPPARQSGQVSQERTNKKSFLSALQVVVGFSVMSKALAPWVLFGIFAVNLAAQALPPPAARGSGFDLAAFGRLPLSANGRVHRFESVARPGLAPIRGPR